MIRLYFPALLTFLILFSVCLLSPLQAQENNLVLTEPFPGISIPNLLGLEASADSPYIYLLSQQGQVYRLDTTADGAEPEVWLDISDRLISGGEQGLLGLAFAPDFDESGLFYVNYTRPNPLRTTISRFSLNESGMADAGSEQVLLEYEQPFTNHNGGQIAFGPDGYLYISSGDGGSGGDPQGNGQNIQTLLGAILRIDVNTEDASYLIPEDNPFAFDDFGADEIFAWGLRNPWRFSFDRETGEMWAGDVGQNAVESIHIIENGLNYGWAVIEGSNCYPQGTTCDTEGLELPVFEYSHDNGDRSITGGYVYRGEKNPSLQGKYIYGDFISGRMWALEYDTETEEVISNELLVDNPFNLSSFGEDADGELYVMSYSSGRIYTIATRPEETSITYPENGQTVSVEFTMEWESVAGADVYAYQISLDSDFEELIFDATTPETQVFLTYDTTLDEVYARVKSINAAGESEWSDITPFIIEIPSSTETEPEIPGALTLNPAYPNPFNPSTTISFLLPEALDVRLEVYNNAAQRVAILAKGTMPQGQHDVRFDASDLSSGIYFVHLQAGGEQRTQKIMLIK
jgi:glucose/arabinose dehydrogenase